MGDPALIDAKDLFGAFRDVQHFQDKKNGFETSWQWPLETGQGTMYMIKLRPGFILGIGSFRLMDKIAIKFDNIYCPLIFNFGISGSMTTTVNLGDGRKDILNSKPGHNIITYLPMWQGVTNLSVGTSLKWVVIYLDPFLLDAVVETKPDWIPEGLCDIVAGANDQHYYHMSSTTPVSEIAITQILDCPYQGPLKRMYFEGKALELITHSLARLVPSENHAKKPFILRPQDIDRVRFARELVRRDLQNPPRLLDLARTVGLPHTKLNYGFREIYGTTIFDYLRQTRLHKARSLLDDGRMNVTEAANAVGYSSLSHFAKSFKGYYGTSPGSYLRSVSGKW